MAAGRYTIQAEQGATLELRLTWRDSEGDPIDLSTYSARMEVRRAPGAGDALISIADGDGITLDSSGHIDIEIDAETMSDCPAGDLRYDIEVESAGGKVTRVLEGVFKVSPEVTE